MPLLITKCAGVAYFPGGQRLDIGGLKGDTGRPRLFLARAQMYIIACWQMPITKVLHHLAIPTVTPEI